MSKDDRYTVEGTKSARRKHRNQKLRNRNNGSEKPIKPIKKGNTGARVVKIDDEVLDLTRIRSLQDITGPDMGSNPWD